MRVNGQKPLPQTPVKRYIFALNKPKGYICANSTPTTQGRGRLVVDIFQVCCLSASAQQTHCQASVQVWTGCNATSVLSLCAAQADVIALSPIWPALYIDEKGPVQNWIDREWKRDHLSGRAIPPRLFTVGRLDSHTTGLIFVTNDGELSPGPGPPMLSAVQQALHPANC